MNFNNVLNNDFIHVLPQEAITSLLVMITIIILTFVIYAKGKKYQTFDKPKGIVNVAEMVVSFADDQVESLMGKSFDGFGGYIIALSAFIFFGFLYGMIGIPNFIVIPGNPQFSADKLFSALPNPFINIAFPLSIAFLTILMIQGYAIHFHHIRYLKRFLEPIPIFGAITMWIPMISLTLRLFGNALAGFCLVSLAYGALSSTASGFGLVLAPAMMPVVHFYFDLFEGVIQTVVFVMITMMDVAQEAPIEASQEETARNISLKVQTAR
jgi:F-type H+-transporting ATPase subunit a